MNTDSGYRMLIDAVERVKLAPIHYVIISQQERITNGGIYLLSLEQGIVWDLCPDRKGIVMKPRQPYDMWIDQDNSVHIRQWRF